MSADPKRRELSRGEIVEEHFTTSGLPKGHGFTQANRDADTAYYSFDKGRFRFVVMDTVNPNGYADGSIDPTQFAWLKTTIESAKGKAVMVFSHHTSASMTNPFVATGGDPNPRVLGDEVTAYLLSQPRLIAWVNGHTHRNQITAHKRAGRLRRVLGDQHRLAHRLPAAVASRRGHRQRGPHPVDLHHDHRPRRTGRLQAATSARPSPWPACRASCRSTTRTPSSTPPASRRTATPSCWCASPPTWPEGARTLQNPRLAVDFWVKNTAFLHFHERRSAPVTSPGRRAPAGCSAGAACAGSSPGWRP